MRQRSTWGRVVGTSAAGIGLLALIVLPVVVRCTTAEFGVRTEVTHGGGQSPPVDENAVRRYVEIVQARDDGGPVAGNDVRLLIDGRETYDAMLESIASSRQHVHLETYIIQDDQTGNRMADALIARARSGVTVRMIHDGYGSTDSDAFWRRLGDAGVQVHAYSPPVSKANVRDHRKVLVVDGRTGFTGGINFYDAYSNESGKREEGGIRSMIPWFGPDSKQLPWRDTHLRIEGPAVAGLQKIFVEHWEQLEDGIDPSGLYPELPVRGDQHVSFKVGVGGNTDPSETRAAYVEVFGKAQDRIWITQAYFVPDAEFLQALADAARRGVDVKVIAPGVTDVSFILYAARRLYGELLEAGVQVFEYQDAVLHAKTAVVDGAWAIVGSSNFDALSFRHNHEIDAIVIGREFAREMEAVFMDDLGHTRQVTLAEWRKRPLGYRVLGLVAAWFRPWL